MEIMKVDVDDFGVFCVFVENFKAHDVRLDVVEGLEVDIRGAIRSFHVVANLPRNRTFLDDISEVDFCLTRLNFNLIRGLKLDEIWLRRLNCLKVYVHNTRWWMC